MNWVEIHMKDQSFRITVETLNIVWKTLIIIIIHILGQVTLLQCDDIYIYIRVYLVYVYST